MVQEIENKIANFASSLNEAFPDKYPSFELVEESKGNSFIIKKVVPVYINTTPEGLTATLQPITFIDCSIYYYILKMIVEEDSKYINIFNVPFYINISEFVRNTRYSKSNKTKLRKILKSMNISSYTVESYLKNMKSNPSNKHEILSNYKPLYSNHFHFKMNVDQIESSVLITQDIKEKLNNNIPKITFDKENYKIQFHFDEQQIVQYEPSRNLFDINPIDFSDTFDVNVYKALFLICYFSHFAGNLETYIPIMNFPFQFEIQNFVERNKNKISFNEFKALLKKMGCNQNTINSQSERYYSKYNKLIKKLKKSGKTRFSINNEIFVEFNITIEMLEMWNQKGIIRHPFYWNSKTQELIYLRN